MRQEILEVPRALRLMWEKARPQYNALVRRAVWSERPAFVTGKDSGYWAGLTGALAFESLLKLPVLVREPEAFNAYSAPALAMRSLLVAISASGECEPTLLGAQNAKKRGATVWGLTANPASRLAVQADAVAPLYLHEAPENGMQAAFCQHAAMILLALAAARALQRPAAPWEALESELEKLPQNVERVENQFTGGAKTFAAEFSKFPNLWCVGAGFYFPIASQAAKHLREASGILAQGIDPLLFQRLLPVLRPSEAGILFISGSRCALKGEIHKAMHEAGKSAGAMIFAITDNDDRQLSEAAAASVLLPTLTEPVGALLSLAFLDCVAHYAAARRAPSSGRRSAST